MEFNPAWRCLERFAEPIPSEVIEEVTAILFAPDPTPGELVGVNVCVVLGSRNCGYKARRAAELFGQDPRVLFVACGGNRSDSGPIEAELIRGILFERGVSDERVIVEGFSTDTGGNLRHAQQLISERVADPRTKNIAIVSSGFHRSHVLASLPPSLRHSIFVNAFGPRSGRDNWHTNQLGRAVVLHELMRPGFSSSREPVA